MNGNSNKIVNSNFELKIVVVFIGKLFVIFIDFPSKLTLLDVIEVMYKENNSIM